MCDAWPTSRSEAGPWTVSISETQSTCTLHPTPYTLHPSPYTLHFTPYTLHPTLYTPHPTPYTLHPAPSTLHPTHYTLHNTLHTLHSTPYTTLHPNPTPYTLPRDAWATSRSEAGPWTASTLETPSRPPYTLHPENQPSLSLNPWIASTSATQSACTPHPAGVPRSQETAPP